MERKDYVKIATALSNAIIKDFRGFLEEGVKPLEVPKDKLHLEVAYQEMLKIPNWKYESGIGQNPLIEYMIEKNAIYITQIYNEKNEECQRTVGYLTDVFSEEVDYRGKKQPLYEVLRNIAIGMGYDVDEYTLKERTENSVKTPVDIVTYKGETNIRKSNNQQMRPYRKLSEGSKPVFGNNGELMGFITRDGRYLNKNGFQRYADLSPNTVSGKQDER